MVHCSDIRNCGTLFQHKKLWYTVPTSETLVHCSNIRNCGTLFWKRNCGTLFRNKELWCTVPEFPIDVTVHSTVYILYHTDYIQNSSLGLDENSFIWGRGKKEHFSLGEMKDLWRCIPVGVNFVAKPFLVIIHIKREKWKIKGLRKESTNIYGYLMFSFPIRDCTMWRRASHMSSLGQTWDRNPGKSVLDVLDSGLKPVWLFCKIPSHTQQLLRHRLQGQKCVTCRITAKYCVKQPFLLHFVLQYISQRCHRDEVIYHWGFQSLITEV